MQEHPDKSKSDRQDGDDSHIEPAVSSSADSAIESKTSSSSSTGEGQRPHLTSERRQPPATTVAGVTTRASGQARIRDLQVMLSDLGHYDGPVDGSLSTATRNAIYALQNQLADEGLFDRRANGIYDSATARATETFVQRRSK